MTGLKRIPSFSDIPWCTCKHPPEPTRHALSQRVAQQEPISPCRFVVVDVGHEDARQPALQVAHLLHEQHREVVMTLISRSEGARRVQSWCIERGCCTPPPVDCPADSLQDALRALRGLSAEYPASKVVIHRMDTEATLRRAIHAVRTDGSHARLRQTLAYPIDALTLSHPQHCERINVPQADYVPPLSNMVHDAASQKAALVASPAGPNLLRTNEDGTVQWLAWRGALALDGGTDGWTSADRFARGLRMLAPTYACSQAVSMRYVQQMHPEATVYEIKRDEVLMHSPGAPAAAACDRVAADAVSALANFGLGSTAATVSQPHVFGVIAASPNAARPRRR